jgi:uncharacterized protein
MSESELESFLKNSKVDLNKLANHISNEDNNPFPPRHVLESLGQTIDAYFNRTSQLRMIALAGLRGIGKTTLMWQLAKKIYDQYSQDIYFFDIKELSEYLNGVKLHTVLLKFEEIILKKRFYELDKPIIFLFDEVHDADNWSRHLKILHNKCKRAFIICTGSSALLLDTNPDLPTLWYCKHIFPFSFSEFIQANLWRSSLDYQMAEKKINTIIKNITFESSSEEIFLKKISLWGKERKEEAQTLLQPNLEKELKKVLFFSDNIEMVKERMEVISPIINSYMEKIKQVFPNMEEKLKEYINYYNIPRFFSTDNKEIICKQTIEMFEKILFEDVLTWLKIKTSKNDSQSEIIDIPKIRKLLFDIASSDEFNLEKFSNTGCTKKEIELFIDVLNKAEVLNVFLPYVKNSNRKLFFMSPTLRVALHGVLHGYDIDDNLQAILYEEIVAMYLKNLLPDVPIFFAISKNDHQAQRARSPDFVIETGNKPIILEVKTKKIDTRQIANSKIEFRYGILIVAEAKNYSIVGNTLIIPLSWFFLL